jgi:hypothetical protein
MKHINGMRALLKRSDSYFDLFGDAATKKMRF